MNEKLLEILNYYSDTYTIIEPIGNIFNELIENDVKVKGDSFFCPIEKDGIIILLAGTKDKADLWVLKEILKLIKTKQPILTAFNGNSDYLINSFKRYDIDVLNRDGDMSIVTFNMKGIDIWQHFQQ